MYQIPEGEGYSIGTFEVSIPSLGFHSGPVERDGSLEKCWVFDANRDQREDILIVIRNSGSGSYVDITALENRGDRFSIVTLPSIPDIPGYMGHDTVSIRNGSIVRSFPIYSDQSGIRINYLHL